MSVMSAFLHERQPCIFYQNSYAVEILPGAHWLFFKEVFKSKLSIWVYDLMFFKETHKTHLTLE